MATGPSKVLRGTDYTLILARLAGVTSPRHNDNRNFPRLDGPQRPRSQDSTGHAQCAGGWEEPCLAGSIEATVLGTDLIVMGELGRRGIGQGLLGSVAERVMKFSEIPVLVMKEESSAALGQPICVETAVSTVRTARMERTCGFEALR